MKERKKTSIGEQIIEGLEEAVAFSPAPTYSSVRIARIRDGLRLSQAVFAMALNVSAETVRAWEQGKREPDGAALRLLQIAEQHPEWVLETVSIRSRVGGGG